MIKRLKSIVSGKTLRLSLAVVITCGIVLGGVPSIKVSASSDFDVTVIPSSTVQSNWMGLGVQWAPYQHFDTTNPAKGYTAPVMSDASWTKLTNRLSALKPGFTRFMIQPGWEYFNGLDSNGNPIVDYENAEMHFMYKCLDYCQSHNITVMYGEFGPRWKKDNGASTGNWVNAWSDYNTTWANMIAAELSYLINTKGYTCIKYYDMENEPYGSWSFSAGDWSKYKNGLTLLNNALTSCGIRNKLKLDCCWNDITASQINEIKGVADVFDEHQYGTASNTYDYATAKNLVMNNDSSAVGLLIGECGIGGTVPSYPHTGTDSSNVFDYSYSTNMANRAVQAMRDGLVTVDAWDLDDAMHTDNDDGVNLKRWGMWDSMGTAYSNTPSLEDLRPWFYPWTLIGNNFPAGTKIVSVDNSTRDGVSTTAGVTSTGYSVAIVNNNSGSKTVNVKIDCGPTNATVKRYVYFSGDQPKDSNGYPVVKDTTTGVNMQQGYQVTLNGPGIVVLSVNNNSSQPAQQTNLALNKSVTVSSTDQSGNGASNLVDGNVGTRWSSAYSDNQSATIDLGSTKTVGKVILNWEAAYATAYKVQVSSDNSNWTDVYSTTTGDGNFDIIHFAPVSARYIRLVGQSRATQYGYSLWEFGVFAGNNPVGNAPVGSTVWLKANSTGNYVSAWIGGSPGTNPLEARSSSIGTWEKYKVIEAGDGCIALQALANNQYVSAWLSDTNTPLEARSTSISTWEKFQWVDEGSGFFALKAAANGLYVSAWVDSANNNPLQARASSASGWEYFTYGQ